MHFTPKKIKNKQMLRSNRLKIKHFLVSRIILKNWGYFFEDSFFRETILLFFVSAFFPNHLFLDHQDVFLTQHYQHEPSAPSP